MRFDLRHPAILPVTSVTLAALALAGPVQADTVPSGTKPPTVSADPLPTWQVNGVVWSAVTVGNTVYATGKFTKARPPGTAPGNAKEVTRNNLLAFDIRTGALITSFNHSLNGQGLRIAASPDGSRVYVGGEFTTVDGQTRNHIAAFNTATGALDPAFKPSVSGKVRAIAATNSTVYFGGNFFSVNGAKRTRLAAAAKSNGALSATWKPVADDDEVFALLVSPDGKRVIVGGRFQKLNGATHVGIGAVNGTNGAIATWYSKPIPTRVGERYSYVSNLTTDGTTVYGSADGEGGKWFDGRFAATLSTGALVWLDNCYGATYGVQVVGKALYSVGHAHDCSSLGAFPETVPQTWHRTLAETTYKTGTDKTAPGSNSNYSHPAVPTLLHWFPTVTMGSYTGQYQAAWTVTGNSSYIALGGEFPSVNGKSQQGLVRFAVKSLAPNKVGPTPSAEVTPVLTTPAARTVKVTWKTTWDQDNEKLTYEVLRDGGQTPVYSTSLWSAFWAARVHTVSFTDTGLTTGSSHTYRIRVTDPLGNVLTSATSSSIKVG
ncbi:hypothetical protein ACRYCC_19165 [Actinomadura scrupuli]|uniref:hypothetical protein n=1 Tax=Actinomadura scrupuli TaxID=559629 RepID=UPI003D988339